MMGPMGWNRAEYLAVVSGRADEATRQRFARAWNVGDPELRALFDERKQRAIQLLRLLPPCEADEGNPKANAREIKPIEQAEVAEGTSDAVG